MSRIHNALCVAYVGAELVWMLHAPSRHLVSGVMVLSFVAVVVFTVAAQGRRDRSAARKVLAYDDRRIIGPLLEVIERPRDAMGYDEEIQSEARRCLARLLPGASPEQLDLLTPRQRGILCREIAGRAPDLARAALSVAEQLGEQQAIAQIERLLRRRGRRRADRALEDEGRRILPALQRRAEETRERDTLLRAAADPGEAPASLLRPARGTASEEETRLLRPDAARISETHKEQGIG